MRGSRPEVGLMLAMPQKCAGSRTLPGRVAAQAEGGSARGDQRGLATARSTGCTREVVRIIGAAVDQVVAFEGKQEVRQICSCERNGAGGAQTRHHRGIPDRRCGRLPPERSGRAHRPFHFDRILDRKRNACQRTQLSAVRPLPIHLPGGLPGTFRQHLYHRLQLRIHAFDALEMCLY